jgi:hypothetical protein
MTESVLTLLRTAAEKNERLMASELNQLLYGDSKSYVPPTRWQRFVVWLGDNRLTNAWLVLIGREDIDREYR